MKCDICGQDVENSEDLQNHWSNRMPPAWVTTSSKSRTTWAKPKTSPRKGKYRSLRTSRLHRDRELLDGLV
jgi:hypothetical protein